MKQTTHILVSLIATLSILVAGCSYQPAPEDPPAATVIPQNPTEQPQPAPTMILEEPAPPRIWYDSSVPAALRQQVKLPVGVELADKPEEASLVLAAQRADGATRWTYALAVSFPTLTDAVPLLDLLDLWRGRVPAGYQIPLGMAGDTLAAFEAVWGPPAPDAVQVLDADEMLPTAWEQPGALFILPFEELEPRWKVLRVDGMSPLDKEFDPREYPLGVWFDVTAADGQQSTAEVLLPATNRDPQKMTVVLMTGVTALVRATAAKMEAQGMTFPGKDILPWFQSADLRHISNEIAFSPDCPEPNPYQTSLIFCSQPEYIELLEYVGANVIELTGNHQIDWGHPAFDYTLNLYEELGMPYYAAGANAEEARKPLLIEHNGNKIAFIGCNPSGPEMVWATELFGGVAQCDFEWMQEEIRRLRREGYLPIATMQYFEYYTPDPRPWQVEDFQGLAEAGAVIVSGSQAHKPQAFDFYGSHFIHYGVGNLFFDQMDIPVVGTRQEFLDRHVIYDGRHISTELLTAMLEDYARPRPMTLEERQALLREMFVESKWLPAQVP